MDFSQSPVCLFIENKRISDLDVIRKATNNDSPVIKKLMQSEPGFWKNSWQDNVIDQGIKSANGLAFVRVESGQIFGSICVHDLGFRACLSELIVKDSARNIGVDKKLIRHIENELRTRRGCKVLISDVWRGAESVYRSLGWTEPDVVLLRKKLTPKNEVIKV
ncbi:MAG: GNAT family N-acetyltransferase, partial [Desulfobacterales bacterium]